MSVKRPAPSSHFSCQLCYRRKVKCDRGNPCTYCVRHKVECIPSPVETATEKPRKQRFPEAELLNRIKRYERALQMYGADVEAIRNGQEETLMDTGKQKTRIEDNSNSQSDNNDPIQPRRPPVSPYFEADQVLTILDGGGTASTTNQKKPETIQTFLDQVFEHDGSSMLFAVDTKLESPPPHPAPFDIFKLWQVYCDNIHPLNKVLHSPTFQRKISSYGSHLHLAPAGDQALFFAVYVAALSSLSSEECEAIFYSTKQSLLEEYQLSTQIWLRRAGLWRTSDLVVLQAFVLFLSTLHNTIDPRTLVSFTAMADRIARRMGLFREVKGMTPVEQEMRKRLWWEITLLDARTAEKAGMGSSYLAYNWNVGLPSERSDLDIESVDGMTLKQHSIQQQPSSEMIFFLIRSEAALFLSNLRNTTSQGIQVDFAMSPVSFDNKIKAIDDFEEKITSKYLLFCDEGLANHRMTKSIAQIIIDRMRISTYIIEEASSSKQDSRRELMQNKLLGYCISTLEQTNKIRSDSALNKFDWFMQQHLPIFALVHTLRLLQIYSTGQLADRAWQAVQVFKEKGLRLPVDSLILKAWKMRRASLSATFTTEEEDPSYIKDIEEKVAPTRKRREEELQASNSSSSNFTFSTPSSSALDSDYMTLLAEMSGNAEYDFDWSSWLNDSNVT